MGTRKSVGGAFSLLEVVLGMGLAAVLLLTVILMGMTALSGDTKASHSQLASAVAESQLDLLGAGIAAEDSAARRDFWNAPEGRYAGGGTVSKLTSDGTDYELAYTVTIVKDNGGSPLGVTGNQLRQVDLQVSWWEGEKGRPGYGRMSLARTRLFRETDVR